MRRRSSRYCFASPHRSCGLTLTSTSSCWQCFTRRCEGRAATAVAAVGQIRRRIQRRRSHCTRTGAECSQSLIVAASAASHQVSREGWSASGRPRGDAVACRGSAVAGGDAADDRRGRLGSRPQRRARRRGSRETPSWRPHRRSAPRVAGEAYVKWALRCRGRCEGAADAVGPSAESPRPSIGIGAVHRRASRHDGRSRHAAAPASHLGSQRRAPAVRDARRRSCREHGARACRAATIGGERCLRRSRRRSLGTFRNAAAGWRAGRRPARAASSPAFSIAGALMPCADALDGHRLVAIILRLVGRGSPCDDEPDGNARSSTRPGAWHVFVPGVLGAALGAPRAGGSRDGRRTASIYAITRELLENTGTQEDIFLSRAADTPASIRASWAGRARGLRGVASFVARPSRTAGRRPGGTGKGDLRGTIAAVGAARRRRRRRRRGAHAYCGWGERRRAGAHFGDLAMPSPALVGGM